jgi:hypothetical protein
MLCRGQPEEFAKYVQYCKNLKFEEKPDYNFLRGIFKSLMQQHQYEYDGKYDWVLLKEGKADQLKLQMQQQEKGKPPIAARNSNMAQQPRMTKEFAEERKESRANIGA